jgi:hypothetical protein
MSYLNLFDMQHMGFAHNRTGIIVASIIAAVVVVGCVGIVMLKGNLPFTCSRKTPNSFEQDVEAHRKSASIRTSTSSEFVVFDSFRLSSRLDDSSDEAGMPRICLTGPDRESLKTLNTVDVPVLTYAKVRRARRSKVKMRHVPENLRIVDCQPDTDTSVLTVANAQCSRRSKAKMRHVFEDLQIAGCQPDAAQIDSGEQVNGSEEGGHKVGDADAEQTMVDPMSFTFGSGKSMAGLYHK